MIPLDGWPAPPEPTPADPPSLTLTVGVLALAFVCVVVVLLLGRFADRQANEHRQRARELERACAEERRERLLEHLIDVSPGGRKPWQERRK